MESVFLNSPSFGWGDERRFFQSLDSFIFPWSHYIFLATSAPFWKLSCRGGTLPWWERCNRLERGGTEPLHGRLFGEWLKVKERWTVRPVAAQKARVKVTWRSLEGEKDAWPGPLRMERIHKEKETRFKCYACKSIWYTMLKVQLYVRTMNKNRSEN